MSREERGENFLAKIDLQVYFSFLLPPPSYPRLVTWTRVLLALLDSLSLLTTVISGATASLISEWHGWVRYHTDCSTIIAPASSRLCSSVADASSLNAIKTQLREPKAGGLFLSFAVSLWHGKNL